MRFLLLPYPMSYCFSLCRKLVRRLMTSLGLHSLLWRRLLLECRDQMCIFEQEIH